MNIMKGGVDRRYYTGYIRSTPSLYHSLGLYMSPRVFSLIQCESPVGGHPHSARGHRSISAAISCYESQQGPGNIHVQWIDEWEYYIISIVNKHHLRKSKAVILSSSCTVVFTRGWFEQGVSTSKKTSMFFSMRYIGSMHRCLPMYRLETSMFFENQVHYITKPII